MEGLCQKSGMLFHRKILKMRIFETVRGVGIDRINKKTVVGGI
jgi:hypothetical protein